MRLFRVSPVHFPVRSSQVFLFTFGYVTPNLSLTARVCHLAYVRSRVPFAPSNEDPAIGTLVAVACPECLGLRDDHGQPYPVTAAVSNVLVRPADPVQTKQPRRRHPSRQGLRGVPSPLSRAPALVRPRQAGGTPALPRLFVLPVWRERSPAHP